MQINSKPSLINADTAPISSFFIGITVLLLLIGANHWLFERLFCVTYLQWYLGNAAVIGIGSAVFATVWGVLDDHPEVISAHPMRFAGAYFRLIALFLFALSNGLRGPSEAPNFDSIVGMLLTAIVALVVVIGIVVVAPLQYFVFLVCGAPGRLMLRSDRRVLLREGDRTTEVQEVSDRDEIAVGWRDISFKSKPFTLTNLIVILLAAILKFTGFDNLF